MTLTTLLYKLSLNKEIHVKTIMSDGKCHLTIEEMYNFNLLHKDILPIKGKIDPAPFIQKRLL